MNRLERALGILLLLRSGKTVSAVELGNRFEVSPRTIYRDIEMLSALGVPVYAEMGREGGFRLMEGYFLPPVMFTAGEAVSLLLGLTSLRRFRAKPHEQDIDTAERKLLAAVPERVRGMLTRVQQFVGFEEPAVEAFSLERVPRQPADEPNTLDEGMVLTTFLESLLKQRQVALRYYSPYSARTQDLFVRPAGLLWDRDRWYLIGSADGEATPRLWRADRVLKITPHHTFVERPREFNVRDWMGRQWLAAAMQEWIREAPVQIRMTRGQAERLKQDWYYRHARYEDAAEGMTTMTLGADNREVVFELVRWLGPGAELLAPQAWRELLREELTQMAFAYQKV